MPTSADVQKHMTPSERMILGVLLIMIVAALLVWLNVQSQIRGVEARISLTEEEIVLNRALQCRVLLGLGLPIQSDGPCYSPEVLHHYDPVAATSAQATQTQILDTLCELVLAHDIDYVSACQGESEKQ